MGHEKNQKENFKNAAANQSGSTAVSDSTVDVLYQKMGDRWFAFSMVDNEVFVGSISPEELATVQAADGPVQRDGKTYKISGNS